MDIFRERLKDIRIENGYKQEEMAKLLNVSTSGYGYYEQGRNEPSLETIQKIAVTLNVSADYLLGIIDTPSHPVEFTISDDLSLSKQEITAIKKMKEDKLLGELSKDPNENVERLIRYWEFIKRELNR
ncbi:helix-turn-helix domain-containing protein [Virgibacillus kimchii]